MSMVSSVDDAIRLLRADDPTLTALIITQNAKIDDEGASALAVSLSNNSTLRSLSVFDASGIGVEGTVALANALRTNSVLTKLVLLDHDSDSRFSATLDIDRLIEINEQSSNPHEAARRKAAEFGPSLASRRGTTEEERRAEEERVHESLRKFVEKFEHQQAEERRQQTEAEEQRRRQVEAEEERRRAESSLSYTFLSPRLGWRRLRGEGREEAGRRRLEALPRDTGSLDRGRFAQQRDARLAPEPARAVNAPSDESTQWVVPPLGQPSEGGREESDEVRQVRPPGPQREAMGWPPLVSLLGDTRTIGTGASDRIGVLDDDIRRMRACDLTLTKVHLRSFGSPDEGNGTDRAKMLADALRDNSTVNSVHLSSLKIGADGATALAESLRGNSTVTSLILFETEIGAEGAKALANALFTNTAVARLDLTRNNICAEGAEALADTLRTNSVITTLILSENNIGNEGATALADALCTNWAVTYLCLFPGNSISTELQGKIGRLVKINGESSDSQEAARKKAAEFGPSPAEIRYGEHLQKLLEKAKHREAEERRQAEAEEQCRRQAEEEGVKRRAEEERLRKLKEEAERQQEEERRRRQAEAEAEAKRHAEAKEKKQVEEERLRKSKEDASLLEAIRDHAPIDRVEGILAQRPDLAERADSDGRLPLHEACRQGASVEVVKLFIDAFPPALQRQAHSTLWLPLHVACMKQAQNAELIELLVIKDRSALQCKDSEGWLPLHYASCRRGNAETIRVLANHYGNARNERTLDGKTPYELAQENDADGAVLQLLKSDEQIAAEEKKRREEEEERRRQAEAEAKRLAEEKRLRELKEEAERREEEERHRRRAEEEEAKAKRQAEEERLRKLKEDASLLEAIRNHSPSDRVEGILAQRPDLARREDSDGRLPLHEACRRRAPVEIVKLLVDANPSALRRRVHSTLWLPLHVACMKQAQNTKLIELLVSEDWSALQSRDSEGWLPLHHASCRCGNADTIRVLTNHHSNARNERTLDGKTPYELAQENDAGGAVLQLLKSDEQIAEEERKQLEGEKARQIKLQQKQERLRTEERAAEMEKERNKIRDLIEKRNHDRPVELSAAYVESIRKKEELGRGFFGVVYRGWDAKLNQDFAVKQIHQDLVLRGDSADVQTARATFQTELNTLLEFNHPNIACLYGYHLSKDLCGSQYLVFELAEKGSLDKFWESDLGRDRLSSIEGRVKIALEIALALHYLHKGGDGASDHVCCHRDIKSANICLTANLSAKLIDAGLAKLVPKGLAMDLGTSSAIVGHPGYRCPQYESGKLKKKGYQPACDIFSLGIVMVELLTGHLQNYDDAEGNAVNFYEKYILDGDEIGGDIDDALGEPYAASECVRDFAHLALSCMNRKLDPRPSAWEVVVQLRHILKQYERELFSGECHEEENVTADVSLMQKYTCRSCKAPDVKCIACKGRDRHHYCSSCMSGHISVCAKECKTEIGCPFAGCDSVPFEGAELGTFVEQVVWQGFCTTRALTIHCHALSKKVEEYHLANMRMHSVTHGKIDESLQLLTNIGAGVMIRCPRIFLLFEAERMNAWKHPRSWLRSATRKKYRLYFVCAHSNRIVEPAIKIRVSRDWVEAIAPALAVSLVVLQIVGAVHGFDIPIGLFEINAMDDTLKPVLSGDDRALVERARNGELTERDVRILDGSAFELVAEKAMANLGWRDKVVPVRDNGAVKWVKKEYEHHYS